MCTYSNDGTSGICGKYLVTIRSFLSFVFTFEYRSKIAALEAFNTTQAAKKISAPFGESVVAEKTVRK